MSFRQTIAKFVSNHSETSENHSDPVLQTHYYKTTGEKAITELENLFKHDKQYKLNAVSKERGEISATVVKGRKAFIVCSIIMVRPYQTAIDFSVTTESLLPIDMGYSFKLVQQLYQYTDKKLPPIENKR